MSPNKEQKKRFLERIEEPEKNWKFSANDARERQYWDDYMEAYEDMLRTQPPKRRHGMSCLPTTNGLRASLSLQR
jgi:polyphosphate kinase 2 (PPK2 family)